MRLLIIVLSIIIGACSHTSASLAEVTKAKVQVLFSKQDDPQAQIIKLIDQAKQSIKVAAYSFTDIKISKALLKAHNKGIDVAILADAKANSKYSAVKYLENKGIKVKRINNLELMHHKFMIFDQAIVQTGSYNYTKAARNNAENIIIIYDPKIAKQFLYEWHQIKSR